MEKCNQCESTDLTNAGNIIRKGSRLMICKNCSLSQFSPLPTSSELENYYSSLYRKEHCDKEYYDNETIAHEQKRANLIIPLISKYINASRKVLDIGCSSGILLKNMLEINKNLKTSGLELNNKYLKNATDNNFITEKDGIYNMPVENLESLVGHKSYDFISIVHVLEHLRKPKQALQMIKDLLSPQGHLYIEVPNLHTPYGDEESYFGLHHLYYFTPLTLKNILNSAGFNVIELKRIADTSVYAICKLSQKEEESIQVIYTDDLKKINNFLRIGQHLYHFKLFIRRSSFINRLLNFKNKIFKKDVLKPKDF